MDRQKLLKEIYTTVYSLCFSPCGKFLAACTNFGQIGIFSIQAALSPESTEKNWKPILIFHAHDSQIYSLISSDRFLISSGSGCIKGWLWNDLIRKKTEATWTIPIPYEDHKCSPEVNAMAVDYKDGISRLYAGCGDNNVYQWDLESGRHLLTLKGHTDYVHDVSLRNNDNECVSASEDGSVRLWDIRSPNEASHIIEPFKNEECNRPKFGKWLGCVAMDPGDDWMVCGGGPKLSLWYMRSMSMTTIFESEKDCPKFAKFSQDSIISGGTGGSVSHSNINGELKISVPASSATVYNVAINDKSESNKVLAISGNSSKIDICTNFGYKAFSLEFS